MQSGHDGDVDVQGIYLQVSRLCFGCPACVLITMPQLSYGHNTGLAKVGLSPRVRVRFISDYSLCSLQGIPSAPGPAFTPKQAEEWSESF